MDWKAPHNQEEIGKQFACETEDSYNGRTDELFDLSSLTDDMRENDSIEGHKHEHDGHEDSVHADDSSGLHAEDAAVHEHSLDLAAVRAKLRAKSGKQYWRTLEELADDPHFDELLHREFPRQASEWDETVDRRDFLKLAAASLAFAGISGCGDAPEQLLVPYVKQPDGMILGKPQFYATAMPFGADAIGASGGESRGTAHARGGESGSSFESRRHGRNCASFRAEPVRSRIARRRSRILGEIRTWEDFLKRSGDDS